jgi:hypothetical protein
MDDKFSKRYDMQKFTTILIAIKRPAEEPDKNGAVQHVEVYSMEERLNPKYFLKTESERCMILMRCSCGMMTWGPMEVSVNDIYLPR